MSHELPKDVVEYFRHKKVVVTGGAGFVGSHVVEMLLEAGAAVTVPVRTSTSLEYIADVLDRISVVQADLSDRANFIKAVDGSEVVIHLAAAKGGGIVHSMGHHGSLFRDNMQTSINLMEAVRECQPQRTMLVSSACVYPRDAAVPTPEEDGTRDAPEPTNAGYGWSKRMSEYLALSYVEEFGLNIGIVRPYNTYGPRDDFFKPTNHVIPGIITRLFNGENPLSIWGSGRQTRSFLYVKDSARGILQACAYENVTGPINLGNEEETSIADLARLIVEVSGLDVEITFDPSKPDGQPRRTCDTSKAKRLINYQTQVNLRQGLLETVAWYQDQLLKKERVDK